MGTGLLVLLGIVAIGVTFYVINMDPPSVSAKPQRGASASQPMAATSATAAKPKHLAADAVSHEKMPHASAAAAGDAQAQYELGMQYLAGEVTGAKNPVQAIKWLEMAAKQGHADARYHLGVMYRAGQGALQNFETAFQWFELAAMQNHAEAQFNVGMMHKSGMSVPIDPVKAYMWVNLAAAQGHTGGIAARDSLLQTMTPQQVVEGQRASRDWKPAADADKADKAVENAKPLTAVSDKK